MKKQTFPVTNIGSVSLLMVFIVLCLVTFATLSLSSATSDYRFSQNIATHNTQYYDASNKASLQLKEIDKLLLTAYQTNSSDYFNAAAKLIQSESDLTAEFSLKNSTITYQETVNDNRSLKVVLTLNKPGNFSNGFYRITSWQETSTADWKSDNSLNLIK